MVKRANSSNSVGFTKHIFNNTENVFACVLIIVKNNLMRWLCGLFIWNYYK